MKSRLKTRLYIMPLLLLGVLFLLKTFAFADMIIPSNIDTSLQVVKRLLITLDGSPIGSPIADLNTGGNIVFYAPIKDANGNTYLTHESDPYFSVSAAANITSTQINHWNTAYTRGNHALMGYLTGESDPLWMIEKANYYTKSQVDNLLASSVGGLRYKGIWDYSTGALPSDANVGYFFKISVGGDFNGLHLYVGDMIIANTNSNGETQTGSWDVISNSTSESDPLFSASVAANISGGQVAHWDEAYGRGNHALMGYLTGEADPLWMIEKKNYYTKDQIDAKGYLTTELDPIWNTEKSNYYTKDQINNQNFLTSESDPIWLAASGDYYTKIAIDNKFDALSGLSNGINTEADPIWSANSGNYYTKGEINTLGFLTGIYESDPIWLADKSNYYTRFDIDNKGYLTSFTELDPLFLASPAAGIASNDIYNWSAAVTWIGKNASDALYFFNNSGDYYTKVESDSLFLTGESDPIWSADKNNYYTKSAIDDKGFITGFMESDPIWNLQKTNYYTKIQADARYLTGEGDPIFSVSPAAGISADEIAQWNNNANRISDNSGTTYTKAQIDAQGYLTGETDPIWNAAKNNYYTKTQLDTKGFLTGFAEVDPLFASSIAGQITPIDFSNWYAAYNWVTTNSGDALYFYNNSGSYYTKAETNSLFLTGESDPIWNADKNNYYTKSAIDAKGFLMSFTELDPVFSASVAAQISSSDLAEWHGSADWISTHSGDALYFFNNSGSYYTKDQIDDKGYLTGFMESDPIWNLQKTNYYTKVQADAKYLTGESDPIWNIASGNYYTKQEINTNFLTGFVESDPLFITSPAYLITSSDLGQWSSALSWINTNSGNFYTKSQIDALGFLTGLVESDPIWNADKNNYYTKSAIDAKGFLTGFTEVDPLFAASIAGQITPIDFSNWYTAYNWVSTNSGNYYTKSDIDSKGFITGSSLSSYLQLDQTIPQTAVGTFSFPAVKSNSYQDLSGNIPFVQQNGGSIYHTIPWTATGTVSTNGTTVTGIGTSFAAGMANKAKIVINGEEKLITAYTSTTQITVASAFSQNYSGKAFAIYSRAIDVGSDGTINWRPAAGSVTLTMFAGGSLVTYDVLAFGSSMRLYDSIKLANTRPILWTNNTTYSDVVDVGLKRNSVGTLEIYDGTTGVTNGNLKLGNIYANGSVGIGTGSPGGLLSIAESSTGVGIVSNTAGGTTVIGSGTRFTKDVVAGGSITIGGQTVLIGGVSSDTGLTVQTAITNANTNTGYTIAGGSRFNIYGNGSTTLTTDIGYMMADFSFYGGYLTYGSSLNFLAAGYMRIGSTNNTSGISFSTKNNNIQSDKVFIYGNGNMTVGISPTSSSYGLFQVTQGTAGIGTVTNLAGGTTITGTNTQFTNIFKVGDAIVIGGQTGTISAITSDTVMTTSAITSAHNNSSFSLVGGDRLVVLGNGNVGIGTINPSYPLTLSTAYANTHSIAINDSAYNYYFGGAPAATLVGNYIKMAASSTIGYIRSNMDFAFYDSTSASILYLKNSNRNVGIGTTTPTSSFQVSQGTAGFGTVTNLAGGTTVTGTNTQFTNTFKVGDSIIIGGQTGTISAITSDTVMTTSAITSAHTNSAYTLVGGDRFVVKGNGNVGIGTTGPNFLLDLSQNISMDTDIVNAQLGISSASTPTKRMILGYDSTGGTNGYGFGYIKAGYQVVAWTPLSLQPNGGNVGIGTTTPTEKLDVNGNIQTNNNVVFNNNGLINMTQNSWGDKWYFAATGIKMSMDQSSTSWLTTFGGATGLTKFRWSTTKQGAAYSGPVLDLNDSGTAIFYGNIGVGTTSPSYLLDLKSTYSNGTTVFNLQNSLGNSVFNIAANGSFYVGAGKIGTLLNIGFQNANDITTNASGMFAWTTGSSANYPYNPDLAIGRNSAGTLEINNGTAGTFADLIARNIYANGSIGIGTTSPASKLQVVGDIQLPSTGGVLLGAPNTEGTRRITTNGGALSFQVYHGSAWVEKSTIAP